MKVIYFLALLTCVTTCLSAQTGINTTTPHPSSVLDISAANKGVLIPRILLTGVHDAVTIPSPANGLMIYHNGNVNLNSGLYVNSGTPVAPTWAVAGENRATKIFCAAKIASNINLLTNATVTTWSSLTGQGTIIVMNSGVFTLPAGRSFLVQAFLGAGVKGPTSTGTDLVSTQNWGKYRIVVEDGSTTLTPVNIPGYAESSTEYNNDGGSSPAIVYINTSAGSVNLKVIIMATNDAYLGFNVSAGSSNSVESWLLIQEL